MRYFRFARPLIFVLALIPVVSFGMPHAAHAANASFFGPIVPQACHCDSQTNPTSGGQPITTAPAWGCVLQVIQNCINLLVSFSVILMVLYLALGGAQLITSAGSPGAREQAKQRLINVVVGLVVVLSAWLVVDFIMKTLYDGDSSGFGPWNAILAGGNDCLTATNPSSIVSGSISVLTGSGTSGLSVGSGAGAGASGLSVSSAISKLNSSAVSSDNGQCLHYVAQALSAGGVTLTCPSAYAGQCNSSLQALGFNSVGSSDIAPQAGDIIVVSPVGSHTIGHIAMYNGTNWVSDFVQSSSEKPPGCPYSDTGCPTVQYWRP